jgi:hypothetical protein
MARLISVFESRSSRGGPGTFGKENFMSPAIRETKIREAVFQIYRDTSNVLEQSRNRLGRAKLGIFIAFAILSVSLLAQAPYWITALSGFLAGYAFSLGSWAKANCDQLPVLVKHTALREETVAGGDAPSPP